MNKGRNEVKDVFLQQMSQQAGKSLQRKQTHYVNAILITALALVMLGVMSILMISFKYEEANIKEDLVISAYLKDGLTQTDVDKLIKRITAEPSVHDTHYISKEAAMDIFKEKFNEDPEKFLKM